MIVDFVDMDIIVDFVDMDIIVEHHCLRFFS